MAIREDSQSDIRLQGFVDLISTEYFSVHGVTIDVDQDTSYSDANGDEISKSDFFGLLTTTSFVKIGGNEIAGTVVLAEKVSLQLDD